MAATGAGGVSCDPTPPELCIQNLITDTDSVALDPEKMAVWLFGLAFISNTSDQY